MNIVVLDGFTLVREDLSWVELCSCGEWTAWPRSRVEEIPERITDAEIVVVNKAPLSREAIQGAAKLRFVTVTATGYNIVDVRAAQERGIPVSNVPNYGTSTVAQYTMALLLELCNHVGRHAESVRKGEWSSAPDWTYWRSPQVELAGLTLGVMGFGRIGKEVARLAACFGMKILYSSRSEARPLSFPCERVSTADLFARADVVTLHSALSADTAGLVSADLLSLMKPGAFLISTARGQLIVEADLAEALEGGVLAGAALDVLATEPPDRSSPLLSAPNCLVTPHIAWSGLPARRRILETTIRNIQAFLEGHPIHVVNGR
jgi:glycerate dehydrogenase